MEKREYLVKTSPGAGEKIFFRVEVWDFEGRERRFLYSSVLAEGAEDAEQFLTRLYRSMFAGKPKVEVMGEEDWAAGREAQASLARAQKELALKKDRERKKSLKEREMI